jgi:DNA gyrase subunit A
MSVIASRALPDVRDGLKPSQRRILVAMHDLGLTHRAKHRKCAKIAGDTSGNYHPHGEQVIYPTLVHMAQDFSLRYPLVDGQGNFGSIDGDPPAQMRYTEARMTAIAEEMLADIDKETVDFQPNYDNTRNEPKVLPAKIPQLILNGSMGIAVGMATNIPPHNLSEVCDALILLCDKPEAELLEIMQFIKGPDFPTGGIIFNPDEIKNAYALGKGRIVIRGRAEIEEKGRTQRIIISEIPFLVNKAQLVQKIAELVKERKIEGISDVRDESDRHGIRVVIELKANAYAHKILNSLYEHTPLQTIFYVNMLALTKELEPRVFTLKDLLLAYLEHRREVIVRRTSFLLKKARERLHILEGLKTALDNIDEVIEGIRNSENREAAKQFLISNFKLSSLQAEAILEMRLSALARLEREKVEEEIANKKTEIANYEKILADPSEVTKIIKEEILEIKNKYKDERRTEVRAETLQKFAAEDLIPDEEMVIVVTEKNYIKRTPLNSFRQQARGGKGVIGISTKAEDRVDEVLIASTHDDILFFSNFGRVFRTKVYEIPLGLRQAKGQALVNFINLAPEEKITAVVALDKRTLERGRYLLMASKKGIFKKTEILAFQNCKRRGLIALKLKAGDLLRWVKVTEGGDWLFAASNKGQAILFPESELRPLGRSASGVRGMKLEEGEVLVAVDTLPASLQKESDVLVITEKGYGKRTPLSMFRLQRRDGRGIKLIGLNEKTGLVADMQITTSDSDSCLITTFLGQTIRIPVANIRRLSRQARGVRLIKLEEGNKIASVAVLKKEQFLQPKGSLSTKEETKTSLAQTEKEETQTSASDSLNSKKEKTLTEKGPGFSGVKIHRYREDVIIEED